MAMCRQFNKQSVKKKIFGVTTLAAFGLLFWLRSPDILGEKQRLPASPAITQAACTQPQHHPSEKTSSPPENRPVPSHPSDFTYAARLATPAVVHIQSTKNPRSVKRAFASPLDQLLKELFGDRLLMPREYQQPAQEAFGSGVIYKSNGYIITNNHVVEGADQIKVTLNDNRSYEAKLVGADPTTDLALLKIEACNLPVLVLGNSDQLEVGEWVLAVGNPLNLCSTVTKGIVSAKSRALENSGSGELRIQSFIQTDAVINKGNSGGALVNLSGELVGINTAIYASATAAFIGYGFAIPSSLVKKVADDFIQYGAVQRVLLGVTIQDVNAKSAKELGLKAVYGVRIDHVSPKSPCVRRLQKDDVITQINGRPISKATELQEIIGCAKPGDKIAITFYRRGKQQTVDVVLEHRKESVHLEGATFQNLDSKSKAKLKISNGVLVKEIAKGKFQAAGLQKGYILLAFDKQPVTSTDELAEMVKRATEPVMIQIMDPNKGTISYLAVELGTPIHHTQHRE